MQAEPAAGADHHLAVMERIGQVRQTIVAACLGSAEFSRTFHAEGFVRPFGVELPNEGIEAYLLLQTLAHGGRVVSFFRAMCMRS